MSENEKEKGPETKGPEPGEGAGEQTPESAAPTQPDKAAGPAPRKRKGKKGDREAEPAQAGQAAAEKGEEGSQAAPPPEGGATPPPPAASGGGGKGPWAIAVLALLFTLLVAAGGAWFWWQDQLRRQQIEQRLGQLDQRLAQAPAQADLQALAQRLDELGQRLDRVDRLSAEVADLKRLTEETEARMKAALDRLYQRMGRSSVDWILAEAEYLLRLANERLQLARDPDTARAALRAADERLAALDDPDLQPVRAAIASEITALEALPRVDVAGLAARLDALAGQVEALPLARRYLPPGPPEGAGQPGAETGGGGPWWERAWARLVETVKGLVVVRYNEEPVSALLGPEQVAALRQGLMLELDLARAALVRGDETLYRQSLTGVGERVRRYFDVQAPQVQALLQAVDELAAQTLRPSLPDLSESLRRLREVKAHIGGTGEGAS